MASRTACHGLVALAPPCTEPAGLTTRTRGSAPRVISASDHIAPIHPRIWIRVWVTGANTNCPSDPPALMTPAALPRSSAGRWRDAAPISTEKLLAPEPAAERR